MGFKVRWKEFGIEGTCIYALSSDDKNLMEIKLDNGMVKILDADELELVKDSKGTYIKTPIDSIDTCICCGKYCTEGKQICINCESKI